MYFNNPKSRYSHLVFTASKSRRTMVCPDVALIQCSNCACIIQRTANEKNIAWADRVNIICNKCDNKINNLQNNYKLWKQMRDK